MERQAPIHYYLERNGCSPEPVDGLAPLQWRGMVMSHHQNQEKSMRPFLPNVYQHKLKDGSRLHVTFIDKEGAEHEFAVSAGDNLMDIAQAEDLEMEGPLFPSPASYSPFGS